MMTSMTTLGKTHSMLLNDGNQRELHSSRANFLSESASFSVKTSPTLPTAFSQLNNINKVYTQRVNFDNKRVTSICKYCNNPGHSVNKCYRVHGFPVDFKFTKGKKFAACTQLDELRIYSSSSFEGTTPTPAHGFTKE